MKVLHILDSLNRGGAEMLALDVCRNARANNFDLTFVATGGGDLEAEFAASGVDYVRLQRRAPLDVPLVAQLRRVIKERDIGVVHCHQAVEALHAYFATLGTNVKRVMSFHLAALDRKNGVTLKFLSPRMDANVAVSRDMLRHLASEEKYDTSKNFHVVYNGIDACRLQATNGARDDLRDELNVAHGDLLFGMVGNFYPGARKDQLTVCRALPQVFAEIPHAQFVFVGGASADAPQIFEECVAFCRAHGIDERVRFLGKRADIPAVLRALDVFALSSRKESFGIAVVEAMMLGVPAVVSDIGALLEVTKGGATARVFRTGDAADLSRQLIDLARDAEARARLSQRACEWALGEFAIETHIENLLKLYGNLGSGSIG